MDGRSFDSSAHPRGGDGEFINKNGGKPPIAGNGATLPSDDDPADEVNERLGDMRGLIRRTSKRFIPKPDEDYWNTPDGPITQELLAHNAKRQGYDPQSFSDRLGIMYDGSPSQCEELLDNWDDEDTVTRIADDVEDDNADNVRNFDLADPENWEPDEDNTYQTAKWLETQLYGEHGDEFNAVTYFTDDRFKRIEQDTINNPEWLDNHGEELVHEVKMGNVDSRTLIAAVDMWKPGDSGATCRLAEALGNTPQVCKQMRDRRAIPDDMLRLRSRQGEVDVANNPYLTDRQRKILSTPIPDNPLRRPKDRDTLEAMLMDPREQYRLAAAQMNRQTIRHDQELSLLVMSDDVEDVRNAIPLEPTSTPQRIPIFNG